MFSTHANNISAQQPKETDVCPVNSLVRSRYLHKYLLDSSSQLASGTLCLRGTVHP